MGGRGSRGVRATGLVVTALAVVLVVGMVAYDAFGRAGAGERLVDAARPTVGEQGIVELRSNLDVLVAGFEQIGAAFPAIAGELGASEAELEAELRRDHPEIGALADRQEEIAGAFEKTVSNLEAHQEDFDAADDIPVDGVPMTVAPWVLLGLAAVLAAAGVVQWRTGSAGASGVIVGIGVVLIVGTLALRIPQKSDQAADLVDSLTFSREGAAKTRDQFEVADGFVTAVVDGVLPDVAAELGTSTDALVAELDSRVPGLEAVLPRLRPALDRIELDVRFREERFEDGQDVQDLPLRALPWFVVGFGAVLVVVGAGALVAGRRSRAEVGDQSLKIDR